MKANEKKYLDFLEYIENIEKDTDIDISQCINHKELMYCIENGESFADYIENLNEDRYITDAEVIYYHSAIDFLRENDSSLQYSLEIATEYGYTTEKINSELLASLLSTRQNEEEFYEIVEKIREDWDNIS